MNASAAKNGQGSVTWSSTKLLLSVHRLFTLTLDMKCPDVDALPHQCLICIQPVQKSWMYGAYHFHVEIVRHQHLR